MYVNYPFVFLLSKEGRGIAITRGASFLVGLLAGKIETDR